MKIKHTKYFQRTYYLIEGELNSRRLGNNFNRNILHTNFLTRKFSKLLCSVFKTIKTEIPTISRHICSSRQKRFHQVNNLVYCVVAAERVLLSTDLATEECALCDSVIWKLDNLYEVHRNVLFESARGSIDKISKKENQPSSLNWSSTLWQILATMVISEMKWFATD